MKTNTQRQADLSKKRREKGQRQASTWIDKETDKQLETLSGMTKTHALNIAIKLGLHAIAKIKDHDLSLYLSLIDGDLTNAKTKIDATFSQEATTTEPLPPEQDSTPTKRQSRKLNLLPSEQVLASGKEAYELEKQGLSHGDIAKKLGKGRSTISEHIRKYKHSISN